VPGCTRLYAKWTVDYLRLEIMSKKSIILGLILFLAGIAALGWVFTEGKKERQLLQERQERFDVGVDRLDRLVTGEIDVHSFADLVPSENQKQELDKYRARMERRELILVVSVVCIYRRTYFWLVAATGGCSTAD